MPALEYAIETVCYITRN